MKTTKEIAEENNLWLFMQMHPLNKENIIAAIDQAKKEAITEALKAIQEVDCDLFEHVVNEDIAESVKEDLFKQIDKREP